MVGLTLSFDPHHNILITAKDNKYFVCKLAIVKYFDRLVMWADVLPEFDRYLNGQTGK